MFKVKHSMVALATAFGGVSLLMVGPVSAQQSPPPTEVKKIERIEITGSNIRRTDTETVAPVSIITREQIERSGSPTIAEVLRNIPANSGGSYSESFSNSFAPGASGLSLRGLGQKATLVLINGRRTAGYGFAQNLQDTFVDLNSIPSSAVERVEVLLDGASAIYGSDAIAGVVNIILRRDFKGIELAGGLGRSEGKNDYRFNATGGFGDLASDKYNFFGVLDVYKRDLLLLSDTEFGKTRDFRKYAGGRNFTGLTTGGTWQNVLPTGALGNTFKAIETCNGTVLTGPEALAAGLLNPATATTAARAVATNTFCTFDQNKQITALPKTQRVGFLGRATAEVSQTVQAYGELGLSQSKTFQVFTSPFFNTTGLQQTPAGLKPFAYTINFAPGVAGNPLATNARFQGNLDSLGTRDSDIKSDTYRLLGGVKYAFGSWEGDSAAGFSRNKVSQLNLNRMRIDGVSAAFNVPATPQPPVPLSTSALFNLNNQSANSAAVSESMLVDFSRKSTSQLTFVDTKLSTQFGALPGGPIGLAIGGEYRKEKLADKPADVAQQGLILGQGITSTTGDRNSLALFAEMALPITKSLEGQLAVRSDRYSDYGRSNTPKVGLKWKPTSEFLVRANWGKGFRAPTLPEISPSVATFFVAVNDPVTGASGVNISGAYSGNPNLKAEKSVSKNLGIVFEPNRSFNVSADYYNISWEDQIGAYSFQSIVNGTAPAGVGTVIRDPITNNIVTVLTNYINLSKTGTRGVDLNARFSTTVDIGKIGIRGNLTYVDTFTQDGENYAGKNGFGISIPRTKTALSLDWDNGPATATVTLNHIAGYEQQQLAASFSTPQDPRFQNGVYPANVGGYTTVDLFGRYNISKNFTVSGSVLNVFKRLPPYDPGASPTFLYDFTQYDVRGRQFRVNLTYKM
jgi:iron complex outermembrane recepter protein